MNLKTCVFPTRVGMIRYLWQLSAKFPRFPRARGDDPQTVCLICGHNWFSPRPWGWSVQREKEVVRFEVFPSRVGMVRRFFNRLPFSLRFPRGRGDGPKRFNMTELRVELSPRPWGWSEYAHKKGIRAIVIPAAVGMVRRETNRRMAGMCYPHARGDGPFSVQSSAFARSSLNNFASTP